MHQVIYSLLVMSLKLCNLYHSYSKEEFYCSENMENGLCLVWAHRVEIKDKGIIFCKKTEEEVASLDLNVSVCNDMIHNLLFWVL